jgi:anti-sigma factor RsiW
VSRSVDDLRCDEIVALLGAYIEGALPPAEAARVEGHLAGCDGCTALLDQLRATVTLLNGLGTAPPDAVRDALPDDVRSTLVERFRALTDPRRTQ